MSYPIQSQSILQSWVMEMPLRHQGVLLAAVRGCDNAPKENSAKPIVRAIRGAFMNPADPREVGMPSSFMSWGLMEFEVTNFLKYWDHYPIHFIQHLMHAAQVIGYKHSANLIRMQFLDLYLRMVKKLHVNPERIEEMDSRLTEDRIAKYNAANSPE